MPLDEYLSDCRRVLDLFEKQWRDGMAEDPGGYPAELEPGEWDEQFRDFAG